MFIYGWFIYGLHFFDFLSEDMFVGIAEHWDGAWL